MVLKLYLILQQQSMGYLNLYGELKQEMLPLLTIIIQLELTESEPNNILINLQVEIKNPLIKTLGISTEVLM